MHAHTIHLLLAFVLCGLSLTISAATLVLDTKTRRRHDKVMQEIRALQARTDALR